MDHADQSNYAQDPGMIHLAIEGMSCASCVGQIERALRSVPGVRDVQVNFLTARAHIMGSADVSQLISAVQSTGKTAHQPTSETLGPDLHKKAQELRAARTRMIFAAVLSLPVLLLEMGSHALPALHQLIAQTIGIQGSWMIQFALTSAVLIGPGRMFYLRGVPAMMRAAPDMNSLVAMGTSAAYLFSLVSTFAPHWLPSTAVNVYYESAAVIVMLILMGQWLEARARGRTSQAITKLLDLAPQIARVRRGGNVQMIESAQVVSGDEIEVQPGERIAVDGTVIEGRSYVDESMITGEPVPNTKEPGAALIAGTINQTGHLLYRADAVGADTVLAQIIRMVEDAQAGKLPIQAMLDRVTMYFVPVVMLMALITFVIWLIWGPDPALSHGLVNAVAVLIIACPCAMGLATPISIMMGTGRAAQMGILFRRGEALQRLRDVRVIALDKTGTLTQGAPRMSDMHLAPGFERSAVLAQIAAVEAKSEHPIARAITRAAQDAHLTVPSAQDFGAVPGMGAHARVEDKTVEIGAKRYMDSLEYELNGFAPIAAQLASAGKSPFYAAIDGQIAAIIAVSDPIKPGTKEAIKALHDTGVQIAMISGDNRVTAQAIADELNIEHVIAEVMPRGKVQALNELRARFGSAAFVGDGINDAPALSHADVGIAIGTGTDIAIEAADVVLMSGALSGVPRACTIARTSMRNIRQNLFWAFAYNTALIPVAAGALYPTFGILLSPVLAAGAMALSSLFVVANALRLSRCKL